MQSMIPLDRADGNMKPGKVPMCLKAAEGLRARLSAHKAVHPDVISPGIERFWNTWIQQYFIDACDEIPQDSKESRETLVHAGQEERTRLSMKYLRGEGIEVGALNHPLPIPDSAHVRYVDRFSNEILLLHYPELLSCKLVNVDVIDDGERLDGFDDSSLDFIICNHFLEHCEDPLGTLKSAMRVLKKGGILYCAIPDKRHTFDKERVSTPFNHILRDYQEGPAWSRPAHYQEWSQIVNKKTGVEHEAWWRFLQETRYSVHFHVWSAWAMLEMLFLARDTIAEQYEIKDFCMNMNECIFILENA